MAKEAKININIDAADAKKSVDGLDMSISEVNDEVFDLEAHIGELRKEMMTLDQGSDRFQQLEEEAVKLQRRVDGVNTRVDTMASETLALDQAIGVVQGLTGAYMAVQGAVALFGVENEKLLEVMVKLQAVQSIVEGLNQVQIMLSKESAAGILLRNIRTKLLNASMRTQARVTSQATLATRGLNLAMKALPIVAIIGAITGLVYGISSYLNSSEDATKSTEELKAEQEELAKQAEDTRNKIASESGEFVSLINQLRNTNQNSETRLGLIKQINDQYDTTLSNLESERDFHIQLNKAVDKYIESQINKARFQSQQEEMNDLIAEQLEIEERLNEELNHSNQLVVAGENALRNRLDARMRSGSIDEDAYKAEIERLELAKENEEEFLKLQGLRELGYAGDLNRLSDIETQLRTIGGLQLDLNDDIDTGDTDNISSDTDTGDNIDNYNKQLQEYIDANNAFYDRIESDRINAIESNRERELQSAATSYDELIKLAEDAGVDTTEITEKYQQQVSAIYDKYDKIEENKLQEQANNEQQLADEILIIQERLNMQRELNEAESEEERQNIRENYSDNILELKQQKLKNERDIILQNTNLTEKERQKIIAKYALENEELIADSTTPDSNNTISDWDKLLGEINSMIGATFGQITRTMNNVFQLNIQNIENETARRNKMYEEQEIKYETMLENNSISREEYNDKIAVLEQNRENEELIARRKQFQLDKRMRIAQAIMSGAQAVISALAAPFPTNLILPPINAAAAATQVALIKRQQFRANKGGVVPGQPSREDSVDALLAPGEAVINSTSTEMFGPLLSAINQMGGGNSLLPDTELNDTPNKSFNNINETRAYVVFSDIKDKQQEDERYRRNGRV